MANEKNKDQLGDFMSSNIDDLIPEELRLAVEGNQKDVKEKEEKSVLPPEEDDEEEDSDLAEDEGEDILEADEESDDDSDLSLDPESIDKLLAGELDAVTKKSKLKSKSGEEGEDKPTWHEDEDYAELLEKVNYTGVSQKELDKIIQKAADTKVLENGAYTTGLQAEVNRLKNTTETMTLELQRLKEIERLAHFDNSEEVTERYAQPMTSAIENIKEILDLEGIDVSAADIIHAKDRGTLNKLLEDYALDDDSKLKLHNNWKDYRTLQLQYKTDKEEAKLDLRKHLSTSIPPEIQKKILRNSLTDFMKSDESVAYIKDAVNKGLVENPNPEVAGVINLASTNFQNLVGALASPSEFIHNDKWLGGLAKYMLDASHNKNIAMKYKTLLQEKEANDKNFVKIVKAYRKLAGSAKGITGKPGGIAFANSNGKASKKDEAAILAEFQGLLDGDIKIDSLMDGD